MPPQQNIQFLFGTLGVSQIRSYLTDRGWRIAGGEAGERLSFERSSVGDDGPTTVWIWSSAEHRRFRHQVPNLIFALSVIEQRPALDIANEMYALPPKRERETAAAMESPVPPSRSSPAATSAERPQRLVVRFAEAAAVTLAGGALADTTQVEPGEIVELIHSGGADAELRLEIAAGGVKAIARQFSDLRLLQGAADPPAGPEWSASRITAKELGGRGDAVNDVEAARLLADLRTTLARIDFELETETKQPDRKSVTRQATILAAALAHRLPASPRSERIVWRAIARLLHPAAIRLHLSSTAAAELFRTAAQDDEFRPTAALAWLRENTYAPEG